MIYRGGIDLNNEPNIKLILQNKESKVRLEVCADSIIMHENKAYCLVEENSKKYENRQIRLWELAYFAEMVIDLSDFDVLEYYMVKQDFRQGE